MALLYLYATVLPAVWQLALHYTFNGLLRASSPCRAWNKSVI